MMRPMKLAGSELMFGEGCLAYIKTMPYRKVSIVIGGSSMIKSGILDKVKAYFAESGAETMVISGVEPQELKRLGDAYDAHEQAEQGMWLM